MLLYIHTMLTKIKFPSSNPGFGSGDAASRPFRRQLRPDQVAHLPVLSKGFDAALHAYHDKIKNGNKNENNNNVNDNNNNMTITILRMQHQ